MDATSATSAAPGFAGSARQADILGTMAVAASYGIIFGMLAYVIAFAGSLTVIIVRANCAARAGTVVESVLYGYGTSPLCGDQASGQILALLLPVLELLLTLILIRGPLPANGFPMAPEVEVTVRSVFTPILPRIARMRLRQWADTSRITPDGVLFGPGLVQEFQTWGHGAWANPRRLPAHYAIFTTLHEFGHLALHDVFYSRGGDRALPVASTFVAVFLLVAMPAGALVQGYWLSVVLTGLECVAAVVATRCVLGRILTNLEFLMDNFAAARAIELIGRRLPFPPAVRETPRYWLQRSHPTVAARRTYLRSMCCSDFLWAFLPALPLMALLGWASSPSGESIASIRALVFVTDAITTASLCVLGVFGGAAAARGCSAAAWWGYGLIAVFAAALLLTRGFFDVPPYAADAAARLSLHGRSVMWFLIVASPPIGLAARRWTNWFDTGTFAAATPRAKTLWWQKPWNYLPTARRSLGPGLFAAVLQQFYHAFVTIAAVEAAMFGFVILMYTLDTGIDSWIALVCFLIYFAVPLSHATRPLWRTPLVLDVLFQAMFLSAVVICMVALNFAGVIDPAGMPAVNESAGAAPMGVSPVTGVAAAVRSVVDGSLFRLRGPEMFQEIRWLWALMALVGLFRLCGQRQERRRQRESGIEHA